MVLTSFLALFHQETMSNTIALSGVRGVCHLETSNHSAHSQFSAAPSFNEYSDIHLDPRKTNSNINFSNVGIEFCLGICNHDTMILMLILWEEIACSFYWNFSLCWFIMREKHHSFVESTQHGDNLNLLWISIK